MKIGAATLVLVVGGAVVLVYLCQTQPAKPEKPPADAAPAAEAPAAVPNETPLPRPLVPYHRERNIAAQTNAPLHAAASKLDRLDLIRERFRQLATGDKTTALRAAKQLADVTERETALLSLLAVWTQGDLGSPTARARAISIYGLEAGLGLSLANMPDLAILWANELTDNAGRAAILQQVAQGWLKSDPASAFALGQQLPDADRKSFSDALFANWATADTAAALQWANQLSDPAEQNEALQAIHSTAPVGIGAVLRMDDGYPIIDHLLPGGAADLSGQLQAGDRIIAVQSAPGLPFQNLQNVPLADVVQAIRGEPNTLVQLQIIPAEASPDSPPQTISITRSQLIIK
jgi:hypothetical protein